MAVSALRLGCVLIVLATLASCGVIPRQLAARDRDHPAPRKIVIFFDGTANNEVSDTNIQKLHALVALRDAPNVSVFYVEGVGTQGKVGGAALGMGTEKRVRMAYGFLLKEYRHTSAFRQADEIYLFGFSRGAYAARILASMLYRVGIPRFSERKDTFPEYDLVLDDIFEAHYAETGQEQRNAIDRFRKAWSVGPEPTDKVKVKLLGLFDTVEALGFFGMSENVGDTNEKHGDQLCNVEKVFHAMSLDDNRATVFTPKLLTRASLIDRCEPDEWKHLRGNEVDLWKAQSAHLSSKVEEVWFSGAHSDVGGGYKDTLLGGISMNWMLRNIAYADLVPKGSRVRENYLDRSRDAEEQHLGGVYPDNPRNVQKYYEVAYGALPGQRLKIHRSVLDRYVVAQKEARDLDQQYDWREEGAYYQKLPKKVDHEYMWVAEYPQCFSGSKYEQQFIGGPNCPIEIVDCNWNSPAGAATPPAAACR